MALFRRKITAYLEAQHFKHTDTFIQQVTSMNSDLQVIRVCVVICPLVRCLSGDPLNVCRTMSVWGRGFNNDHSVLDGDHPTIPCYTDSGLDHVTLKDIFFKQLTKYRQIHIVMFFKMNTERYLNFIIFSLTILLFECVAQKVKASVIYLQFMFKIYIYRYANRFPYSKYLQLF